MLKIRNEVSTNREDLITRLEPNMLKSHKTILEAVAGNYFDDASDSDPAYCFAYYDFYKMANDANIDQILNCCNFCKVVHTARAGGQRNLDLHTTDSFDLLYDRKYKFVTCSRYP